MGEIMFRANQMGVDPRLALFDLETILSWGC